MIPDRRSASRLCRDLQTELRAAWRSHRVYLFVSTALLFGSMPIGAWFFYQGSGISRLPTSGVALNPLAQQFSVATVLGDNVTFFSFLVAGALSAGVLTAIGLVGQGIVAGYFLALSAGGYGSGLLAVAVIPHGVPLAIAIVLGAAVSFRLVVRTLGGLVGLGRPLDSTEWRRAGLLVFCGVLALVCSALIEAYVTFRLADLF